MAKKKSKRFIVPSFHFLTTAAPPKTEARPKEVQLAQKDTSVKLPPAPPVSRIDTPLQTKQSSEKKLAKPKPLEFKQTGRRNSALSLSSLKRNKEEEAILKKKREQREEIIDLPKDPFTQVRFFEVWDAYVEELHKKGEKILASILNADTPKLKGQMIHVSYPNELMKVELLKVRPRVLRFLREKLNNYDIDFKITVNEDHTKRFAYTPQEKYELLKEKNEAIALLRKKFNLEL